MTNEDPDLDLLVVECIDRMEKEGPAALDAVCAANPGVAAELRAAIKPLLDVGAVEPLTTGGPTAGAVGPNSTIAGYEILREVGRGGMGVVFEARDPRVGRRVALKVIRRSIAFDEEAARRFEREAAAAGALRHPGLVQLYAAGIEDGQSWLAMEFVEGAGLDEVLQKLRDGAAGVDAALADSATETSSDAEPPRSLTPRELRRRVELVLEVAEALTEVQLHGIVHRDIKPSNIFVRPDGHAVLGDFGLARRVDEPDVTKTGAFAGTPFYASPEQVQGQSSALGPASDVFSLGVTLYELLTLRRPFSGDTTRAILNEIEAVDPIDPLRLIPALPDEIAAITLMALAKEPGERYANAAEFAADLRAFLEFRPVSARRATALQRLRRWARREPLKLALVSVSAAGVLAVVGIAGYALSQRELAEAGRLEELRREAEVLTTRGFQAFMLGRKSAAEEFQRALELVPHDELAIIGHVVSSFRKEVGKKPFTDAAAILLERYRRPDGAGGRDLPGSTVERLEAFLHHAAQDYPAAKRVLRSMSPARTATDFFLQYLVATGSDARKAALLDAAIRTSERPVHVYYVVRAGLCKTAGDELTARTVARSLVRQWPDEPASWSAAGFAVQRFDQAAAKKFFEKALGLDPDSRDAHIALLQLHTDFGDYSAGEEQATVCLQKFPEEAHIHRAVARLRLKQKQLEVAERHAVRAYTLAREQNLAVMWRDSIRLAASLAERRREPDRAAGLLQESIALEPTIRVFRSDLILLLTRQREWAAARDATTAAIEAFPDYGVYRSRRATIYEALGELGNAEEDRRAHCRMNPKLVQPWISLGLLLARRNRMDEALRASRKSVVLSEFRDATALFCHAQNLSDAAKLDEAEHYLRMAIDVEALPGKGNPSLRPVMQAAMAELKERSK